MAQPPAVSGSWRACESEGSTSTWSVVSAVVFTLMETCAYAFPPPSWSGDQSKPHPAPSWLSGMRAASFAHGLPS